MTRPDISYIISKLSRYTRNPTAKYIDTAKYIVRYLAGIIDLGLRYGPKENNEGNLIGYSDSSYTDNIDTSRSTGAYVYYLWNGPISWRSKLLNTIATSSAEAEYMAGAEAAKEALFLGQLLKSI